MEPFHDTSMVASPGATPGAVRRTLGFARYAVSVQYHGGSFLGFTYQGTNREDCVVEQPKKRGKMGTVDLRGMRSVEGRLREALDDLFGNQQWENIQASSRTDRGVHALKNTFHVDIKISEDNSTSGNDNSSDSSDGNLPIANTTVHESIERKLKDGINFYLSRQSHGFETNHPKGRQNPMMNEMRILNASKSPEYMDNPYALTKEGRAKKQAFRVDWNARFSATQRTYVYRILCYCPRKEQRAEGSDDGIGDNHLDWHSYGIPFEWDRAWCLPQSHTQPLDIDAMKEAAEHLVGTHDFSSFRGRLCHRKSPIVNMKSVTITEHQTSAGELFMGGVSEYQDCETRQHQKLVTVTFVANSFLYRQVRNMVGCLVEVGKHGGKLSADDVQDLLARPWNQSKQTRAENHSSGSSSGNKEFRHRPYSTAPPQGLFLVDVQHGNFRF